MQERVPQVIGTPFEYKDILRFPESRGDGMPPTRRESITPQDKKFSYPKNLHAGKTGFPQ
jgi:hypothetical protein